MPRPSRRALLEWLGTGTAALLAGCQADPATDPSTEPSTPTASSTAPPTTTGSETEPEPSTDPTPETPELTDCAPVARPELAWPVPRRSPARDGYVTDAAGFEAAPTVEWEVEPSVPEDSHASPEYGQPVVAHGGVYLVKRLNRGPQRPMYGDVHALDADSGDRLWTSDRFRSPSHPTVWGDQVVVVAEDESLDPLVLTFDRTDGTPGWTRQFTDRDRGFVTVDDSLYLVLGESTGLQTVLALSGDGSTAWRHDRAFTDHVTVGPTVGTDRLYVATREGWLHALDRDDGGITWSSYLEHPTERRPYVTDIVATDCSVFAVAEGVIKALDSDGQLVWEAVGDHGTLATDGETLFTGMGRGDDRELQALDVTTGEVVWTVEEPIRTPPIVAGDDVYLRVDEGLLALDRTNGSERWRTDRSLGDLALASGTLYGLDRETLVALR